MQSVFGQYVQKYVHCMVPGRRCASGSMPMTMKSRDFTDGLYEEEYSCSPPAIAMVIISMVEIALYLWDTVYAGEDPLYGPSAKLFVYTPAKRDEIWRYFTYMFVHAG